MNYGSTKSPLDIPKPTAADEYRRLEQERLLRQRNALIAITEHESNDLSSTFEYLTYISAVTTSVSRVSIWRYGEDQTSIECVDLYEIEKNKHQSGAKLSSAEYPNYFQALSALKIVVADDAQTHPCTREFTDGYLAPLGIVSMMDVPIRVDGVLYGVLCHEHVGQMRRWTGDEQTFAFAVANSMALAIERSHRLKAEQTLRESEERTRAITDSAHDAVLMMDPQGMISYWNPAAERIFGYTVDEAVGRDLHQLIVPARDLHAHQMALPRFQETGCGNAIGKTLALEAVCKSGEEISVELSLSSARIDDDWHAIGIIRDVTERNQAEARMNEIQANYKDLFENATDMIHAITPEGKIEFVNPAWLQILGYTEAELANLTMFDIIDKQYHEHCKMEMNRAMNGEMVNGTETVFVSKDKRKIYVEGNITCKFIDSKPVYTRGMFRDVTKHKLAEQALIESNERMALQTAALESAANGVAITDTKGTIKWINPAFTKLTGYSPDEVIGKNPRVLKSGKNPESFYLDLWATISNGKVWHGDLINRRKDGEYYYEEMTITPVYDTSDHIGHYIAIKQDVTANRLAEEELRRSEETLTKAQQIAHLGNWEWDIKGDKLYWSDEIFRMLGIEATEVGASSSVFFARVHPEDREKIDHNAAQMFETKRWESIEYRILRPDGTQRTIYSDGSVQLDEEGSPEKLTGIMMDISALRESEASFRSVVETANDGIITLNNKGEILSWNSAAQAIFGHLEDEVRGKNLLYLFPDSYKAQMAATHNCDPLMLSGLLVPGCRGTALTGKKKDGVQFPLEITVSSWQSADGTMYSAIVRDITLRKSLEDQLTHRTLHDPLTDLPNRVLFGNRLEIALKKRRRTKRTVGVLFIDLDNFKKVNDTLGHSAGDELLAGVADRLKSCLREGDTAARLGGDEFAVLLEESNGIEGALMVAQRIHDEILKPFTLSGNEAHVGTSIGIMVTETGKETPDEMLHNADLAMYAAKTSGKNRFVVFQAEMSGDSKPLALKKLSGTLTQ